jgi:hypothetical protein
VFFPAVLAAWCGYLALDFLTHAVFLAPWWRATETFWLPPADLFRRIPFGYGSFLMYCAAVAWLLDRIYGDRLRVSRGARFGAAAGFVTGAATALGAYSVFRMPASSLLVWPVSTIAGSTVAGAASAWVLTGDRPLRRAAVVVGGAALLFVLGVVIQNLLFPTPQDHTIL